jgi:hypothetical protein
MSMLSKSLWPVAVLALVLAVPAAAVAAPLSVSQARYVERSFQENSAGDFDYSIRGCFRVLARVDCVTEVTTEDGTECSVTAYFFRGRKPRRGPRRLWYGLYDCPAGGDRANPRSYVRPQPAWITIEFAGPPARFKPVPRAFLPRSLR